MYRCWILALGLFACGRSADDVQAEFEDVIAESNSCAEATDCVVIFPGCPLGCAATINAANKATVEAKAQELIDDYERGGQSCAYGCMQTGSPVCEQQRCKLP